MLIPLKVRMGLWRLSLSLCRGYRLNSPRLHGLMLLQKALRVVLLQRFYIRSLASS
jgi:hypothetical protein